MKDFVITNNKWDDYSGEKAEIYITDLPDKNYNIVCSGYNSQFRLQDAIDFCGMLISTTAKMQSFQRKQQTVSEKYDLLVITVNKAEWIKRSTFELR